MTMAPARPIHTHEGEAGPRRNRLPGVEPTNSATDPNYIPAVTFNGTRISASPTLGTGDAPFVNYNTTIDIRRQPDQGVGQTHNQGRHIYPAEPQEPDFVKNNGNYNWGEPANPNDTGYGIRT